MKQIRLGLENNLTPEQVFIYANPKFNNYQMSQIRLKLEKDNKDIY